MIALEWRKPRGQNRASLGAHVNDTVFRAKSVFWVTFHTCENVSPKRGGGGGGHGCGDYFVPSYEEQRFSYLQFSTQADSHSSPGLKLSLYNWGPSIMPL